LSPTKSSLFHRVRSHQRPRSGPPDRTLDVLLRAVQDLSQAADAGRVQEIVARAARRLVGADGATFVLRDGDRCFYVDEDAIAPLWKGQRFPMEACISGWSMHRGAVATIEDIYEDPRIPHEAYRPTFVRSLLMTPIRPADPLGAIGMYWAHRHRPTSEEIALARALADSTAIALQHTRTLSELDRHRRLAVTDALTGLLNRRGWEEALAAHADTECSVAVIDIDDFKTYNDALGHAAGDQLLRSLTRNWIDVLRPGDVVARLGGDEFAVLRPDCAAEEALAVAERLRAEGERAAGASVGLATQRPGEPLGSVVERADRALYAAKRDGRNRVTAAA
jgi:diguanylate cyclase (GGDEF)-like protein